ncbi:putative alanine rich membrane protein [Mycobacteroides abscessus]|nr:putative alanine rich membrane protein [Mycobacteroides abscessus]
MGQTAFPLSGNEITALVGRAPAFGELDDAARRASCLTGLGLSASTPVLGAQTLDIDGPAVLMVLPAERPGELLAVAVRPGCSQTDPQRVAQTRIGATPSR